VSIVSFCGNASVIIESVSAFLRAFQLAGPHQNGLEG